MSTLRQLGERVAHGEATPEELRQYVVAELREALDCLEPTAPGNGRAIDGWHASACVLRAWVALTTGGDAMKFRKRPELIEALQWLPDDEVAASHMQKFVGSGFLNHGGLLRVPTEEGITEAQAGDYVERRRPHIFTVHRAAEFEARYEPME